MKLLVGCPTRRRDWILPEWREAVLRACENVEIEPWFLFVVGQDDEASIDMLSSWENTTLQFVDEPAREDSDARDWGKFERIEHMSYLRNVLLGTVREYAPEWFLSLDSDILLHPRALEGMLSIGNRIYQMAWAVGGKAHMDSSQHHPSYGHWIDKRHGPDGGFRRTRSSEITRADVLMAVKLMRPAAYNIDYSPHYLGEDLGWSWNVCQAGGHMWWDGRYESKHWRHRAKFEEAKLNNSVFPVET